MTDFTYQKRRNEIENYFDRTAAEAWSRLTSTEPVGKIRQTVRDGRDQMRATLLSWLPDDLSGKRILDAGCGTGALAVEAALRGAEVIAIDLAPNLIKLANERRPAELQGGSVEFHVADMLALDFGEFDHAVAMDSLIHYTPQDATKVLAALAQCTHGSINFTFAPYNHLLGAMHTVGRLFPKSDRAPSIVPVRQETLQQCIGFEAKLDEWRPGRSQRVSSGFYKSQAFELVNRGYHPEH
jgi:magnesium-protoporphyrin O-methyltransferase